MPIFTEEKTWIKFQSKQWIIEKQEKKSNQIKMKKKQWFFQKNIRIQLNCQNQHLISKKWNAGHESTVQVNIRWWGQMGFNSQLT